MSSSNGEQAPPEDAKESPFKAFIAKLRKRHIIETCAGVIAGGWLLIEVVERLLVAHYGFQRNLLISQLSPSLAPFYQS